MTTPSPALPPLPPSAPSADDPLTRAYQPRAASSRVSRRALIGMLGSGALGLTGYAALSGVARASRGRGAGASPADRPVRDWVPVRAGEPGARVLVVIELAGGNDWLATLVPAHDGALTALREHTLPDLRELIAIDPRFGANHNLASTAKGIAFVGGVGVPDPSGSHFEMSARWAAGDSSGKRLSTTGFLGRLCDELDTGAPVTGLSLTGTVPSLASRKPVTLGLPDGGALDWLRSPEPWFRNLRSGIGELGTAGKGDAELVTAARTNLAKALRFSSLVDGLDAESKGYPGGPLSDQLAVAARVIAAGMGVRVIHTVLGGFDTHSGQRGNHDALLGQLDQSVAAFLADLDARGLSGSTLVCTVSEFGRRARENGSGTDHGTASVALLWGPVRPGVHGEPPSLTDLDADDNFKATLSIEDYYATLAQRWFGVDPAAVLAGKAAPLDGLITT